ncbi:hypothetical protein GL50803_0011151 [Giardia duodenalis]|uniref:Uncharacterized protein n=1 Tax=Giardia intestinalis (strain ATCC 50803 / WB clone C6) TaxID=184922 RepID=A8BV17_GIAIC|nr:hypothetical protein GL50803_0011151 [Giardia intestinalis]KAE8304529.1 hypothetical protein GL50803_0011151 [Giardia intestinalis]|eukprot:XP_001704703.1 Hypothetical protein GL50803_11151 [Giardia lamblia ATCC 50803]
MSSRTFVAAQPYTAEDPSNEFSFEAGEQFIEANNPEASPNDAWVLVYRPGAPSVSKYVPVDKLIEERVVSSKYRQPKTLSSTISDSPSARASAASAELVSVISNAPPSRDAKRSTVSSIQRGDPPLSTGSDDINSKLSDAAASGMTFGGTLASTFKAILEKHEAYFGNVAKKREESFAKISSSIGEASTELARCRERNTAIREQIAELDTMIAAERARWRQLAGDRPDV